MCCGGVVYFCSYMGERARATVELMLWLVMIMACCQPHLQAASSRLMEWPLRQGASSFVQRNLLWAPNIQNNLRPICRELNSTRIYIGGWWVGGWGGINSSSSQHQRDKWWQQLSSSSTASLAHRRLGGWWGNQQEGWAAWLLATLWRPLHPRLQTSLSISLNSPSLFLSSYKKTNKTNDKSKGIMHKYV